MVVSPPNRQKIEMTGAQRSVLAICGWQAKNQAMKSPRLIKAPHLGLGD
jgi:hypothetical protein